MRIGTEFGLVIVSGSACAGAPGYSAPSPPSCGVIEKSFGSSTCQRKRAVLLCFLRVPTLRTEKLWLPAASLLKLTGDWQALHGRPSRRHWKRGLPLRTVKPNLALVDVASLSGCMAILGLGSEATPWLRSALGVEPGMPLCFLGMAA